MTKKEDVKGIAATIFFIALVYVSSYYGCVGI